MSELIYLNDDEAEIVVDSGAQEYNISIGKETHFDVEYITIGYRCSEDNVMLSRAEAENLLKYLQTELKN